MLPKSAPFALGMCNIGKMSKTIAKILLFLLEIRLKSLLCKLQLWNHKKVGHECHMNGWCISDYCFI